MMSLFLGQGYDLADCAFSQHASRAVCILIVIERRVWRGTANMVSVLSRALIFSVFDVLSVLPATCALKQRLRVRQLLSHIEFS